jgi:cell wall-associated NlpC family hydrolase
VNPVFNLFRFKIVSIFLFLGMFVYACGVVPRDSAPSSGNGAGSAPIAASSTVSGFDMVVQQLYGAHSEWEGTPYVLGGNGMNGVDCSAFTQMVYREYFGQNLPRNTREQIQEGAGVRRNSIRPGDLIFFRTNRGVLHVGIAIEDGDFLHASVSSGVMISNLSENYWAGRFLGVRRVL